MAMRCFVAIEIQDKLKQSIINLQKELPEGAAYTSPENLHFTLKFLGEIENAQGVAKKLSFLRRQNSFFIHIRGVGAFPSEKSARIIWVGAESPELINLQRAVEEALGQDGEKFIPHVTIARMKNPSSVTEFARKHRHADLGEMRATCVKLKKSGLATSGAVYSDIEEFELV